MSYHAKWEEARDVEFEYAGKWYRASLWEEFQRYLYGADADGNRGVKQAERVRVEVEQVWDEDGNEVNSQQMRDIAKEIA